jgi:hypothetical protein
MNAEQDSKGRAGQIWTNVGMALALLAVVSGAMLALWTPARRMMPGGFDEVGSDGERFNKANQQEIGQVSGGARTEGTARLQRDGSDSRFESPDEMGKLRRILGAVSCAPGKRCEIEGFLLEPVDIDLDGRLEYVVSALDECGSAGCSTALLMHREGSWRVLAEVFGGISVGTKVTNRFTDIALRFKDYDFEPEKRWREVPFVWDGSRYRSTGTLVVPPVEYEKAVTAAPRPPLPQTPPTSSRTAVPGQGALAHVPADELAPVTSIVSATEKTSTRQVLARIQPPGGGDLATPYVSQLINQSISKPKAYIKYGPSVACVAFIYDSEDRNAGMVFLGSNLVIRVFDTDRRYLTHVVARPFMPADMFPKGDWARLHHGENVLCYAISKMHADYARIVEFSFVQSTR